MDTQDVILVLVVVLGRLLLPLLIPRWPLPGVVACLVLDGDSLAAQPRDPLRGWRWRGGLRGWPGPMSADTDRATAADATSGVD